MTSYMIYFFYYSVNYLKAKNDFWLDIVITKYKLHTLTIVGVQRVHIEWKGIPATGNNILNLDHRRCVMKVII